MTGLLRWVFAQTGIFYKSGPWQAALAIGQSGDACALQAGNADLTFISA
jgi:hypothetical protein